MRNRTLLAAACAAALGLTLGAADVAHAFNVRGTGTGALRGGDLTDPQNDGDPDVDTNYEATFAASEEAAFGGGEAAFNVFDNQVGGGNMKWCCGDQNNFPTNPISVDATLDAGAHFLTAFTITSGNDSPTRDPRVWQIQGSNDGTNFTTIFSQNDPAASVWTDRDQVLEFTAGPDFPTQTTAYSTFRFITTATGETGGARFQLGELEYFGNPVPEPAALGLIGVAGLGLLACRRRA